VGVPAFFTQTWWELSWAEDRSARIDGAVYVMERALPAMFCGAIQVVADRWAIFAIAGRAQFQSGDGDGREATVVRRALCELGELDPESTTRRGFSSRVVGIDSPDPPAA